MRHLNQRGLTLVELMVAFAIASLLALAAAPYFSDYGVNSRLRESGNALYAETLFAQSEAIKRNRVMQVDTNNGTVTVSDMTNPAIPVVVRTRTLAGGVLLPVRSFSFGSSGWPTGLAAVSIDVADPRVTCSSDYRCPGLRVDAGGAIRLCGNKLVNCT